MASRGGWLLLVLMLGLTIYDLGRVAFLDEKRPALSVSTDKNVRVLVLGAGRKLNGIHQINDASGLVSAIYLAGLSLSDELHSELLTAGAVVDGKMYNFQMVKDCLVSMEVGFMPASMRMALGVPLDVDQMLESDWDDLPGVGASLALGIIEDRHKNGVFGSLDNLARVKGVGLKRIDAWRPFFSNN
jgi:competence protein ComEA